jgi:hypothetical protein
VSDEREPDETRPIDLDPATQPVEVDDATAPFAPAADPSDPPSLVSSTAANMLLADALPQPSAPEPAVPDPTSGIDSLFGEHRFRDYDTASEPDRAPRPAPVVEPRQTVELEPPHMTRTQRVLLGVAGGLVALIALGALFFLGTRLPLLAPAATPSPTTARSVTPTPTPVATALPPGPVAAGSHRWDQLLGGECLSPYTGPWAERFTVVDCASPHAAQLVLRARFPDPAAPGYPGAAALQAQMGVLCSAPGVIDLGAASAYTDAQLEAAYPATAAQWDAGDHWYYCFVTRSSKDPLTGNLAAARPATPAP